MISYKPLLEMMSKNAISFESLQEQIGNNQTLRSKLNNGDYISLETVDKICNALDLPVEKVIKVLPGIQPSKDENKKIKVNWNKVSELAKAKEISFYKLSQLCRQSVSYIPKAKERNAMVPERVFNAMVAALDCNKKEIEG